MVAAPYIDLRYDTMNFGVLAQYPVGTVSSNRNSASEACFFKALGADM